MTMQEPRFLTDEEKRHLRYIATHVPRGRYSPHPMDPGGLQVGSLYIEIRGGSRLAVEDMRTFIEKVTPDTVELLLREIEHLQKKLETLEKSNV